MTNKKSRARRTLSAPHQENSCSRALTLPRTSRHQRTKRTWQAAARELCGDSLYSVSVFFLPVIIELLFFLKFSAAPPPASFNSGMGMPRARPLACIAVAAIALLAPTRGAEMVERQFVEWVRYMGGLRHSTFQQHALDRASPSYSLVVDANPAFGDFTTIQAAVDSLPDMNLVRVVIRVNPGTYTYARIPASALS